MLSPLLFSTLYYDELRFHPLHKPGYVIHSGCFYFIVVCFLSSQFHLCHESCYPYYMCACVRFYLVIIDHAFVTLDNVRRRGALPTYLIPATNHLEGYLKLHFTGPCFYPGALVLCRTSRFSLFTYD